MCQDEDIIHACKTSLTMAKACYKKELHFNTFKRKALLLWCYKPNQWGKGTIKSNQKKMILLNEILEWKHPYYQTYKLKKRLLKNWILNNKCNKCWITEWNWKKIECELEHIDENRFNHTLKNLMILCPNCHSQTNTFRAKNIKNDI